MNRGTGVPRRSGLLALNLNGSRASFDAQAGHRAATPGFPGAKLLRSCPWMDFCGKIYRNWLVVEPNPPEKYEFVRLDHHPNSWGK